MKLTPCFAFLFHATQAFVPPTIFSKISFRPEDRPRTSLPVDIGNRKEGSQRITTPLAYKKSLFSRSTLPTNSTNELEQSVCRIVTRAGSKLPTSRSLLPSNLLMSPRLLDKLDDYYSASANRETKKLDYLYREKGASLKRKEMDETRTENCGDREQEQKLVRILRHSLEDAGFELLSRRDIDLCDSLNAGYLLRLSIVPDVGELDDSIAKEFYPERFHANGTAINNDELLFDGRVLVYWRGYSEEVTQGRLLLPKLDYLQASLVQRSAAWVKRRLDRAEKAVSRKLLERARVLRRKAKESVDRIADSVPVDIGSSLRRVVLDEKEMEFPIRQKEGGRFKLGRYGGSKVRFVGSPDPTDALQPFMICEDPDAYSYISDVEAYDALPTAVVEREMKDEINHNVYNCEYDEKMSISKGQADRPRMELLERVSINNIVDFFTKSGRRKVIRAIFEKSELVEPTYEEVVVIWRTKKKKKVEFRPPKWVSDLADMFDIEGFAQPPENPTSSRRADIEIRNFEGVPMANLPAVLPKTKLIFRPADAFLFDMISFVTFFLVLGSIRLESPRLDLLALVSVTLWTLRTVFRYSNKLARYDLLVKTFLTSKISHRNAGALRYISYEAGIQRAVRTTLVYYWLLNLFDNAKAAFRRRDEAYLTRNDLLMKGQDDVNNMLKTETQVQMNVKKSLEDLEKLRMIRFDNRDQERLLDVLDPSSSFDAIKDSWIEFFEDEDKGESDDDTFDGSQRLEIDTTSTDNWSSTQSPGKARGAFEIQSENGLSLADFDERRKRLHASQELSGKIPRGDVVYEWQRELAAGGLQPAFEGPSSSLQKTQAPKRWYF